MRAYPGNRTSVRRGGLRRPLVLAGAATLAVVLAVLVAAWRTNHASRRVDAGMAAARTALDKARKAEADRYAPSDLQRAECQWDSALCLWRAQNRTFALSRNSLLVVHRAEDAAVLSLRAAHRATQRSDSLREWTGQALPQCVQRMDAAKARHSRVPVKPPYWKMLTSGRMLLSEAQAAHDRADYLTADVKLRKAQAFLSQFETYASGLMRQYLTSVPVWTQWAAQTIQWSTSKREVALIVNKLRGTCQVYGNGRLKAEYPVEFGPNWMEHKLARGDKATPEGRYRITRKKSGGETKYHRALEINYPNEEDLRRFRQEGGSGRVSSLGGLIELHGGGGKAANWTDGCVALENEDMEKLYRMVKVGTPVTIVGALKADTAEP